MSAKFDEIPSMILQDIKETKRYGHTDGQTDGRTDNVITVYPPTNTVCGGYKNQIERATDKLLLSFFHTKPKQGCTMPGLI